MWSVSPVHALYLYRHGTEASLQAASMRLRPVGAVSHCVESRIINLAGSSCLEQLASRYTCRAANNAQDVPIRTRYQVAVYSTLCLDYIDSQEATFSASDRFCYRGRKCPVPSGRRCGGCTHEVCAALLRVRVCTPLALAHATRQAASRVDSLVSDASEMTQLPSPLYPAWRLVESRSVDSLAAPTK